MVFEVLTIFQFEKDLCRNILLGVTLDNLYINSNLHSEIFVIPKLAIAKAKACSTKI